MRPSFFSPLLALFLGAGPVIAEPSDPYITIPGTVVSTSPAPNSQFVGSPSLVILPDGSYIANHDIFGAASASRTEIYRSTDRGVTWSKLTQFASFWSNLFVHNDSLYCLGTSAEYGDLIIRRSDDSGETWTSPTTAASGFLRGGRYHTAPMPMIVHDGRIWRAFEDIGAGNGWPRHFRAFLMSAPLDADLLDAASWTYTDPVTSSDTWVSSTFNGWLEGNVVETPDGRLVDILRADMDAGNSERAAIIDFGATGAAGTFDPVGRPAENESDLSGFIDFPGGAKKFTIRRDPGTGEYWSLVNSVLPAWTSQKPGEVRNTVSLAHSSDLYNWEIRTHLIFHPDISKHGFQYLDWQFDGDDLIATSRTSWNGRNYHDANFLTFHRFENFRDLTIADSVSTDNLEWKFPGVTAIGSGFSPGLLEHGREASANRNYTWQDVPAEFANSLVTRVGGGANPDLAIRAGKATKLYLAASKINPAPDLDGWTDTGKSMYYSDNDKTKLYFYERDFETGEELTIPQSNWNGTILVVPPAPGPVGFWRGESTEQGTVIPDEKYTFHGVPSDPSPEAVENGAHDRAIAFEIGQHVNCRRQFPSHAHALHHRLLVENGTRCH